MQSGSQTIAAGYQSGQQAFVSLDWNRILISAALAKGDTLTAQQVIERIKKNVGVPWRATTVDTIKAGSADSP